MPDLLDLRTPPHETDDIRRSPAKWLVYDQETAFVQWLPPRSRVFIVMFGLADQL